MCAGTDPCSAGFRIHTRSKPDPFLARLLGYIHPRAEPDLAIARGTTQHLDDGIVKRNGASLDIASVVASIPRGSYRAIVTNPPGTMPAIVANQLIDTNAPALTLTTSGVSDGLYVLQLLDPSTLQPVTTPAYIAVAAEPGYTTRRATFDQAVAATRAWTPSPANAAAAATLVRDLVIAIAEPAWQP